MRRSVLLVVDPIAEMVELARLAEAAGFERVWDWEFFNKNAYVRLAAIACATSRVELGTGISYAFARSPLLTASAAADLDELSGGRMVLGLGTGLLYLLMAVRLYGLVVLGTQLGPRAAVDLAHSRLGGILFLGVSVALVVVMSRWCRVSTVLDEPQSSRPVTEAG